MKAYVISLSKIPASLDSGTQTLESLKKMGFDATMFEGIYGNEAVELFRQEGREIHPFTVIVEDITDEERKKYKKIKPFLRYQYYRDRRVPVDKEMHDKMSKPGVLGCFYSHYSLWKKCIELNEPIYIFEDDVIFVRNFTPVDFNHVLIVALGKTYYKTKYKEEFENPTKQPRRRKWPHPSMPGAVGYGITPNAAKN